VAENDGAKAAAEGISNNAAVESFMVIYYFLLNIEMERYAKSRADS